MDDTVFISRGSDFGVFSRLTSSVRDFLSMTKALKLGLSAKGKTVASSVNLAMRIAKRLKSIGVTYQAAKAGKDVGSSFTAGKFVPGLQVARRFHAARPRIKSTIRPAKVSRRFTVPWNGSCHPAAT